MFVTWFCRSDSSLHDPLLGSGREGLARPCDRSECIRTERSWRPDGALPPQPSWKEEADSSQDEVERLRSGLHPQTVLQTEECLRGRSLG